MMKNLIIAIDNNKVLTLVALVVGLLVGLLGHPGWFGTVLGAASGLGVIALEAMRQSYNNSWSHQRKKRCCLMYGMAVSLSVVISGILSTFISSMYDICWIMGIMAAGLITIATAFLLFKKAWEDFRPITQGYCWVVWLAFLGVVIIMATACFALVHLACGTEATALTQSRGVIYGALAGAGLLCPYVVALILFGIASVWGKIVRWARR